MPGWMKWSVAILIGFGIIVLGWRLGDNRWFSWVLPAFFVMNCLVLIIVVLLQSGKAADLAGAFGGMGSQTVFGPRGTATVLSKVTTVAAAAFMITALTLFIMENRGTPKSGSVLEGMQRNTPAAQKGSAPKRTTPAPATNGPRK